jgi:hypothetical protein
MHEAYMQLFDFQAKWVKTSKVQFEQGLSRSGLLLVNEYAPYTTSRPMVV